MGEEGTALMLEWQVPFAACSSSLRRCPDVQEGRRCQRDLEEALRFLSRAHKIKDSPFYFFTDLIWSNAGNCCRNVKWLLSARRWSDFDHPEAT